MKLSQERKEQWEKNLVEAELMDASDTIVEHTAGDRWEVSSQCRGNYFFTNEKFIFVGGWGGSNTYSVKYTDIKEIKACCVGPAIPFLPTGIKVTAIVDGKKKKCKCSVMKRRDWMAFLSQRAKLTV